jgi:L-fuconolactonase
MPVIDSHCHVSPIWYEPVETLLFQMDRLDVQAAILIQMQGQTDNAYQQECVRRYPGRFASVVVVDSSQPDAPDRLRRLADDGARGVRLRSDVRSLGADPLAIWRAADELGLVVSCPVVSADLAAGSFDQVVQSLPGLSVVLEHLGGSSRPDEPHRDAAWRMARYPNVSIKVTGLGEFAQRAMPPTSPFPFKQPIPTYLRQAYAAFGPERMMWGSDFPPVASREGYANALRLCQEQFAADPPAAQAAIFGDVAARVFSIG